MFLVIVDAHSKWMKVHEVSAATSQGTIDKMSASFATHGLPEVLVTDKGSVFTRLEFEDFLLRHGIRHVTSAPYHPATYGLAERAIQTFETAMKMTSGSIQSKLPFPLPDHAAHDYRSSSCRTANGETVEIHVGSHSS